MEDGTLSAGKHNVVIRVSNLRKRFGHVMAVDGLSFEVLRGEIFGFLGPNGAGKTTTINMICGLSVPTAGQISILGDANVEPGEAEYRVGICPQENIYWPKLSAHEQLAFMGEMYGMERRAAQRRAAELLEWLGLSENANVLANRLSGGMKRRLNVCFALVHDPEVLILDEPEAGLDPQSRVLVRDTVRSLADHGKPPKTVVLTTHNMDEADRLADRVAIIDHGKLLQLDTPERLKKSIGDGDVVEIALDFDRSSPDGLSSLVAELSDICPQITIVGGAIIARSRNVLARIPDITDCIRNRGFKIEGITLRENTLEDVFIHLTGRKLRP
jgi:ABC-2 type transport system ATP-binding protein